MSCLGLYVREMDLCQGSAIESRGAHVNFLLGSYSSWASYISSSHSVSFGSLNVVLDLGLRSEVIRKC